jgi:TraB/PrgY/gumN family
MVVARVLLLLVLVLVCGLARADTPTPPVQDWIETVVVTAHQPGPLMWRVSKGDSTVILLALVEPVPEHLDWNDSGVRAALKGAHQLLLQPRASVGLVEGLWFLAWNSDSIYLPSGTPMESTLPAPLRARFVAARNAIHRDADRYESLRVPLAGLRLDGDFLKANGLTQDEPVDTLRHIANRVGVPVKSIAEYAAIPMLKQLPAMSTAANETCLKSSLDDIDALRVHAVPAAQAWAKGDLDGIKANYSDQRFESCIQSLPTFAALFQRAVNDSANALHAALAKPGKTVMLVSMGSLLRQHGLLEKLEAEGLTIEAPN